MKDRDGHEGDYRCRSELPPPFGTMAGKMARQDGWSGDFKEPSCTPSYGGQAVIGGIAICDTPSYPSRAC